MALFNKEYGGIKTGIGFSKKPIDSRKKDVLRGIVKKRMPDLKSLPKKGLLPEMKNLPGKFPSTFPGKKNLPYRIGPKITPEEKKEWLKGFDEKGFRKPDAPKLDSAMAGEWMKKLNKKQPSVTDSPGYVEL